MIFGLQHNLARGARAWLEKALGRTNPKAGTLKATAEGLDETPFHYGDKGALNMLDLVGTESTLANPLPPNMTAWPMFPTSLADWVSGARCGLVALAAHLHFP